MSADASRTERRCKAYNRYLCNAPANRLNISKIKARLTNLQHVSIKEMQLNTRLFEHLAHSSVTKLSFKKCTVPFAHRAFAALSYFENLSHVDVSRTNLSQSNRNMLRNAAPNLTILDSTRPKPILNNDTGYVRQDYPDAPEAPRANRVKRPRARR